MEKIACTQIRSISFLLYFQIPVNMYNFSEMKICLTIYDFGKMMERDQRKQLLNEQKAEENMKGAVLKFNKKKLMEVWVEMNYLNLFSRP